MAGLFEGVGAPVTIWDDYPFPLASGSFAWLRLPRGEFTEDDAWRMTAMLEVLAIGLKPPNLEDVHERIEEQK